MTPTSAPTRPDVPMGWATEPRPWLAPTVPAFDPAPRLITGASSAPELVQLLGVWSPELHPADATVEPKLDGHRALFLGGGDDRLLSREGAAMGCAAHCLPALRQLERRFGQPMMFDGEFCVPGGLGATLAAFRRGRPATAGVFWMFDAVPLAQWRRGRSLVTLATRKAALARAFGNSALCASVGRVLDHPMDADQVQALARGFWRNGFEGVVIKDRQSLYVRGRSPAWLKLKQGEQA